VHIKCKIGQFPSTLANTPERLGIKIH